MAATTRPRSSVMRTVIDTEPCAAMAGAGPAAWLSHGRRREPCKSAPSSPPPARKKARRVLVGPTRITRAWGWSFGQALAYAWAAWAGQTASAGYGSSGSGGTRDGCDGAHRRRGQSANFRPSSEGGCRVIPHRIVHPSRCRRAPRRNTFERSSRPRSVTDTRRRSRAQRPQSASPSSGGYVARA
jgi:hypothetical protein